MVIGCYYQGEKSDRGDRTSPYRRTRHMVPSQGHLRKTGKPRRQLTYNRSMPMQKEKLTIPSRHFIKQDQSHNKRRRRSQMPGTATTVCPYERKTVTTQPPSHTLGKIQILYYTQGYISSSDGYSRRFDEIVANVQQKTKCIDDTLLWDVDIEKSFFQACRWLDLCGRHRIIQNPEKFVFASDIMEFAGFEITMDSVHPCKKYIQAIAEFPVPKNITDVRSWFCLVNQVA